MAHPAALAAGRSMLASLGAGGGAGPLPEGTEPNYSDEPDSATGAAREFAARQEKDERKQRREFLAKMAEHGLEPELEERRKARERGLDPDADEDDGEETGTAYDDDGDDEPARPMTKRLKKAINFAKDQGLSERAIEAMTDQELLVWARKQSRRESRLNRAPKGTAREKSERSSTQAGDDKQQPPQSLLRLPSKDVLKGNAKKLAEARGWSDEDVDALTAFSEGLIESVKLAIEPALQPLMRDQEDRQASALEDERARLGERIPELSDDEVNDEVIETAKWLVSEGRAKNLRDAYRKAVALEFDDEDYIAARVDAELESRSSTHRRKGRPMVPRQLRGRTPTSPEERETGAMKAVFNALRGGASRQEARRVFQKRSRA